MAAVARVLLADDDPITRGFLRQLLEEDVFPGYWRSCRRIGGGPS